MDNDVKGRKPFPLINVKAAGALSKQGAQVIFTADLIYGLNLLWEIDTIYISAGIKRIKTPRDGKQLSAEPRYHQICSAECFFAQIKHIKHRCFKGNERNWVNYDLSRWAWDAVCVSRWGLDSSWSGCNWWLFFFLQIAMYKGSENVKGVAQSDKSPENFRLKPRSHCLCKEFQFVVKLFSHNFTVLAHRVFSSC